MFLESDFSMQWYRHQLKSTRAISTSLALCGSLPVTWTPGFLLCHDGHLISIDVWDSVPLRRIKVEPSLSLWRGSLSEHNGSFFGMHFHSHLDNFDVVFDARNIYVVRTTVLLDLYKSFLWLLKMILNSKRGLA